VRPPRTRPRLCGSSEGNRVQPGKCPLRFRLPYLRHRRYFVLVVYGACWRVGGGGWGGGAHGVGTQPLVCFFWCFLEMERFEFAYLPVFRCAQRFTSFQNQTGRAPPLFLFPRHSWTFLFPKPLTGLFSFARPPFRSSPILWALFPGLSV